MNYRLTGDFNLFLILRVGLVTASGMPLQLFTVERKNSLFPSALIMGLLLKLLHQFSKVSQIPLLLLKKLKNVLLLTGYLLQMNLILLFIRRTMPLANPSG
jgi:hypothetical protein